MTTYKIVRHYVDGTKRDMPGLEGLSFTANGWLAEPANKEVSHDEP